MMSTTFLRALTLLIVAIYCAPAPALADEGMWTFDHFPTTEVIQRYGIKIDQAWLDQVQGASVKLSNHCSASLVSRHGLVVTNQHCLGSCIESVSTGQSDYMKDGFAAATREDERKCPGLQAEVLLSSDDVTDRVRQATAGAAGADFIKSRDAALSKIEDSACAGAPDLRCDVISLYRGGQFKLYKYRKYSDVRLVFTPEFSTAIFGGDPDNFNFPRYGFDCGFIRIYVDGKPAVTPDHLIWTSRAPKEGELTFVSGHPLITNRMLTVSQLETLRDVSLPIDQVQIAELRGRMIRFAEESAANRRVSADPQYLLENQFKDNYGRQLALHDKSLIDAKRAQEAELKRRVGGDPKLATQIGNPWAEIAAAQTAYADNYVRYSLLETGAGSSSQLFRYARMLVRAAEERELPSATRLPEYSDSRLGLVQKQLLDDKPVDSAFEQLYLEFWLSKTREYLTVDDPTVTLLLGKESPEGLSTRLVGGSKLADSELRRSLWEGGMKAIRASGDPMIRLVLKLEPMSRQIRKVWETKVSGPTDAAAGRIATARFAIFGDADYPDGTATLRLSYGKVAGWAWQGKTVAPFTKVSGLYARATGADPFQLAPRWLAARNGLDPDTTFDFVTTNDVAFGNSGSPLLSAQREILGVVFDGNIHMVGGDFGYDGTINRTVAVSTSAVTQALEKVYGQQALVAELMAK